MRDCLAPLWFWSFGVRMTNGRRRAPLWFLERLPGLFSHSHPFRSREEEDMTNDPRDRQTDALSPRWCCFGFNALSSLLATTHRSNHFYMQELSTMNYCCCSILPSKRRVSNKASDTHQNRESSHQQTITASLSQLRTMLPKSSSCPQPAQRPNHAT